MAEPKDWNVEVMAGANSSIMGRVYDHANSLLTQSTTGSVSVSWKPLRKSGSTSTSSLTVSSVIFNSLQTDSRWTLDATGYNFRWDAPSSAFPTVGENYEAMITFTESTGQIGKVRVIVSAK